MRVAALAFALIAQAACQQDPPAQGARDASIPALTVEGYGDMHIGMPIADARQVSGQALDAPGIEDTPGACNEQQYAAANGDQLYLMFEGDKLTRITAGAEAPHTRTAQNVGVGATEDEVRAAYDHLIDRPAPYDAPPAHDLVVWAERDETAGLRFEIDASGRVTHVHAGNAAIMYAEGCA